MAWWEQVKKEAKAASKVESRKSRVKSFCFSSNLRLSTFDSRLLLDQERFFAPLGTAARLLRRLSLAVLLGALLSAGGRAQSVSEYQMKAAYVYNLAKFVEWPPETFKTASDPITICVLGQSPILQTLNDAVNGETIEDRKLLVRQVSDVEPASNCQILFIGSSDRKYPQSTLRDLTTTGVLTVGEAAGFTATGGVVNFRLDGSKVRIEINLEAAQRQKLRINPKLLSLAQIVKR